MIPFTQLFGFKMNNFITLRGIATALVLISLALPLSRCQRKTVTVRTESVPTEVISAPISYDYTYAHDWFRLTEWGGWLTVFTFSWPIVILLARWRSQRLRQSEVLRWAEVALCLGGGYMIWVLSSFGERLVGAYVGLSGMGLYLIATSRDLIQLAVRRRKKGNRTTA